MSAAPEKGCGERRRRRATRLALALLLAVPGAAPLVVPAFAPAFAQAIESLLSQEEVTEMEELLDRLSFNPGQIDGTVDADTERAIKAYQEFAILPVDGLASRALLNELRAVAGHLDARKPTEQVEAEKEAAEKKAAEAKAAAEEKAAAEQAAAEKAEAERLAAERRAAEEQAAAERAAAENAEAEQAAAEKAEAERLAAEQRAAEEQAAAERAAAEQRAAEEQAAAERAAAEQRAAEQRAAEQRAAEQRAAEQRAAEQRAAEQRAAELAAAERRAAAAKQAEAERLAAEQRAAEQRAAAQRQPASEPEAAAEAERLAAAEQAAAEQAAADREADLQAARERVATATAAERAEVERTAMAELQAARERVAAATAAVERAAAARAAADRAAAARAANAPAQQQARLPASRDGGWRLQLSSLQPLDRAQATWSQLQDSHAALTGLTFLPEPLVLNGRDFARVLAGPLDESEARRRCEALEIAGIYCLPVAGSPGYGTVVEEPPAGNPAPPVPTDSAPLPGNPAQPSSSLAPTPLSAPATRPTVASLSQGETATRQPADLAAPCLLPPGAPPQRLVPTGNDFRAGYEAAGRGAFDLAIAYYGRALKAPGLDDDMRALIHFNCANALHYRGDFVRATANFDRALSLNDRLVDARYNRGFAHRALGKTDEATVDFRTAHDMGLRRLGVRAPDYPPPK